MHSIEKIKIAKFAEYVAAEIADSEYTKEQVALAAWPDVAEGTRMNRIRAFLRGQRRAGKELIEALKQLKIIE